MICGRREYESRRTVMGIIQYIMQMITQSSMKFYEGLEK